MALVLCYMSSWHATMLLNIHCLPSTGLGFHLFDDIHLDIGTSVMIFMGVISFYHHILCCCLWEILLLFICNLNLQKVAQIRKPIEKIVTSFLYKKDIFENKLCFFNLLICRYGITVKCCQQTKIQLNITKIKCKFRLLYINPWNLYWCSISTFNSKCFDRNEN